MRRRKLAAVLAVALLVVTAMPVAALDTQLAVASIHTTDTDFNGGTLSGDIGVDGTGQAATVGLVNQTLFDGFESGSLESEWKGDTGSFAVESDIVKNGSFSLEPGKGGGTADERNIFHNQTEDATKVEGWLNGSSGSTTVIGFTLNRQSGSDDYYAATIHTGTNNFAIKRFDAGSDTDLNTTTGVSVATWYRVEFWSFAGNDTLKAKFFDDSDVLQAELTATDSNYGGGFAGVTGLSDRPGFYDDFEASGLPPESGTYNSQNHTVQDSEQGFGDVTEITNATATFSWETSDGGPWHVLNETTVTTVANHTFSWSVESNSTIRLNLTVQNQTGNGEPAFTLSDEGVQFTATEPSVDDDSASPTGEVQSSQPTLEIDVNDTDFGLAQGDSVDVEFFLDGNTIGTDTLTSNGTASQQTDPLTGGDHTWHVVASDDYGLSNTSATFDISAPGNVTIRNVTENKTGNTYDIINDATAEILIAGDNETVDKQTITDGNVSLEGLPTDEEYVIVVDAPNYHQRSVIVEDVFAQDDIFLLNTSFSSVETTFDVEDESGQFPPDEVTFIVQRAINRSLYDDSAEKEYQWTTIGGDRLNAAGEYIIDLETDVRYRLIAENEDDDRRVLGEYTAVKEQTVTLRIESISVNPLAADEPYAWNATQENVSGTETIKFRFNDSEDETTDLELKIYELDNSSNEIENATHAGPFGVFTHDETLSDDQANATWVVEWSASRNDETIGGQRVVGQAQDPIVSNLPSWLRQTIAIGVLTLSMFFFTGIRAEFGVVVVAALSALFWYIDFLPPEVTGGVVVLQLAVASAIVMRSGRL